MSKKQFEEQLAQLDRLRDSIESPASIEGVRKALTNRNNYIVAKAARIVAQAGLHNLTADLCAALDRFYVDPGKSDPQCLAKNEIIQVLSSLGYDEPEVFLRGLRHVQMEPVWGGREDTAATLRAKCAFALVDCRGLSDVGVLTHLVEVMADPDPAVRQEAVRAVGRFVRSEATLLLRLKAFIGDKEPDVLGACFNALISMDKPSGIAFVSRFLCRDGDNASEAAMALGQTRDLQAFTALVDHWHQEQDSSRASLVLTAIALTRLPEAFDFLLKLVGEEGSVAAAGAVLSVRPPDDVRARLRAAIVRSGDNRLLAVYEKHTAG